MSPLPRLSGFFGRMGRNGRVRTKEKEENLSRRSAPAGSPAGMIFGAAMVDRFEAQLKTELRATLGTGHDGILAGVVVPLAADRD